MTPQKLQEIDREFDELRKALLLPKEPIEVIFSGGVSDTIRQITWHELKMVVSRIVERAFEEGKREAVDKAVKLFKKSFEVNGDDGTGVAWMTDIQAYELLDQLSKEERK